MTGFTWMNNCRTHSEGYKHAPSQYNAISSAPSIITSIFSGNVHWNIQCVVMHTDLKITQFKFRTHIWNLPKMSHITSQAKIFYDLFPSGKVSCTVCVLIETCKKMSFWALLRTSVKASCAQYPLWCFQRKRLAHERAHIHKHARTWNYKYVTYHVWTTDSYRKKQCIGKTFNGKHLHSQPHESRQIRPKCS